MEIKSNPARISKFFNLPPLNQTQIQEQLKVEDSYYTPTHPMVVAPYIFGIEIEVENCTQHKILYHNYPYWTVTADNSLRNNGVEFVSLPIRASQVENALTQLFKGLPNTVEFGTRTSTHVHMNVRDLTIEQICCLVILYTAIENILFNWVGHNRDESIFCIKITETDYVRKFLTLNEYPRETVGEWNKYTALNLHPIESKGSVEFRHLNGTRDKTRILTWINILSCLKSAAKEHGLATLIERVAHLNTSSEYEVFVYNIFGDFTPELLRGIPNLQKVMENPISYIKLALVQLRNGIKSYNIYKNPILNDNDLDRTIRERLYEQHTRDPVTGRIAGQPTLNPQTQQRHDTAENTLNAQERPVRTPIRPRPATGTLNRIMDDWIVDPAINLQGDVVTNFNFGAN